MGKGPTEEEPIKEGPIDEGSVVKLDSGSLLGFAAPTLQINKSELIDEQSSTDNTEDLSRVRLTLAYKLELIKWTNMARVCVRSCLCAFVCASCGTTVKTIPVGKYFYNYVCFG